MTPSQKSSGISETIYYSLISRKPQRFQELPFPQKYNYVRNDHSPDIIEVYDDYQASPRLWQRYRLALRMRWRHGYKPVLFSTTIEDDRPVTGTGMEFSFSPSLTVKRNCLSHYMLHDACHKPVWESLMPGSGADERRKKLRNVAKTRFCCFIYSEAHREQTIVRKDFCQLLAQYKRVDCPGKSLNNMPRITSLYSPGYHQAKLDFTASCKFSIAFENSSNEHYLTEKLPDALYAGAEHIYWGCTRAAEYYNPAAFINCHDYQSFADAVQRVIEVDNNPGLYEEYRNAPPILPATRYYGMMRDMEKQCADMLEEVMARRARKRNALYDGLRLCWLVLRNLDLELQKVCHPVYLFLGEKIPLLRRMRKLVR